MLGRPRLNYPEFPDSWRSLQFIGCEYVLQMLIDRTNIHPEQFGHFLLGEPESFFLEIDLDVGLSLGGRIQQYLQGLHRCKDRKRGWPIPGEISQAL